MMAPTLRMFRRHRANMLNIIMVVVGLIWLGFQLWVPVAKQPPILSVLLQATFGAWLANLSYEQRHRDERVEHRVDELDGGGDRDSGRVRDVERDAARANERMDTLESMASTVEVDDTDEQAIRHTHRKFVPDEDEEDDDDNP